MTDEELAYKRAKNRDRVARYRSTERGRATTRRVNARYDKKREGTRVRVRKPNLPVDFVAFDGEGSNGLYQLLACSATDKIISAREGLTTMQCLDYIAELILTEAISPKDALIGFGLSYDFENMLRDVPDDAYVLLLAHKRVTYENYVLQYVRKKYLDVWWEDEQGKHGFRLQDIQPYFQQSFVDACKSRGVELPEIIIEGKRNRASFSYDDIGKITEYNKAELVAMVKLAETLQDEFAAAFLFIGSTARMGKNYWYGPGAQAAQFLKIARTEELIPAIRPFARAVYKQFFLTWIRRATPGINIKAAIGIRTFMRQLHSLRLHPFVAAYFGGRIECAMQGDLPFKLWDWDLQGAYPYALTRLPVIADKALIPVKELDRAERIGVYLVRWDAKKKAAYCALPYRDRIGTVHFPYSGYGWVMSPELYVATDLGYDITVEQGWVFTQTEGYGRGKKQGDSTLAQFVTKMGAHRIEAKRRGDPAHFGLKLVLNSIYGKTLQKIGARKYFNAFVAAWITSVTRARIAEVICPTEPGVVVSVMTDGILSTKPLPVDAGGEGLGSWELKTYQSGYQFAPGVYVLNMPEGKRIVRYRGFLKFDVDAAQAALDKGEAYTHKNNIFVTRSLALEAPVHAPDMYHFKEVESDQKFDLATKRNMSDPVRMRPRKARRLLYYEPKWLWGDTMMPSWPYSAFEPEPTSELAELVEGAMQNAG